MPWRQLTSLLRENDIHRRGSVEGFCGTQQAVLVKLESPLPLQRGAKLTFPCGQSLTAEPLWQRRSYADQPQTLAAFPLEGVCRDELNDLGRGMGSEEHVRDYPRHDVRLWVSFPNGDHPGTLTRNFSLEGCCIRGDFEAHLGAQLEFYLDLPDCNDPMKMTGEVVWADGKEGGFRFINTHAQDEVRLLRSLGRAAVKPSSFLPDRHLTAPSYSYRLDKRGDEMTLLLSVANWDVEFVLCNARAEGAMLGAFSRFVLQKSSTALTALRSELKLDLERRQQFLHLLLVDDEDNLVLEILGEETSFRRLPRDSARTAL